MPKDAIIASVLELLDEPLISGLLDPKTRSKVINFVALARSNQASAQLATSVLDRTTCPASGCTNHEALEVFGLALAANAAAVVAGSTLAADQAAKQDTMANQVESLWKDSKNGGLRSKPAGKTWTLPYVGTVPRALVVRMIYHALIGAAIMVMLLKSFTLKTTDKHGKTTEVTTEMRSFSK